MKNPEEILYCSTLCSENMIDYLFRTSDIKPLLSVQKFHRLLVEGLSAKGIGVTALSAIPVSRLSHKKIYWKNEQESHKNVKYFYLPFINIRFLRQSFIFIFTLIQVAVWQKNNKKKNMVIICDVLNLAISTATLLIAKIYDIHTCAIVTDIPVILSKTSKQERKSLINKFTAKISSFFINSYDSYVLLTVQMNNLINTHCKPYMILEGLVDINMNKAHNTLNNKALERILIYAGGIYENYGVSNLLKAFIQLEGDELRLHIYGDGEMRNDMPGFMNLDKRINYFGVVTNQTIIEKLSKATLLVNPRPSNQDFTKYSFPSKNLEYMVSGTPLVTSLLPGMPEEYKDYVYIFNDETIDGICSCLRELLSKSREELHSFGTIAKEFVLKNKNNISQAQRLADFLNESSSG